MFKIPSVLRYPNYTKLYFAGLTSELGSFITEVVLMMYVFDLGHQDKSLMGVIRTVFLVALTTGGVLGGPIGERFNRKTVLIYCEVLRIPIVVSLLFLQNIWWIIFANGVIAFFTGVFKPSRQALVNDLVPPKDMRKANGLFGSTFAVLHIAGPLIGATIYASLKSIDETMYFDLFTYLIGIILLAKINYKKPKTVKKSKQIKLFKEIIEGPSYIKKRWDLISVFLHSAINGLCIGILIPLLLPFIIEVVGKSEREFGYFMGLFGIGGIIGGMLSEKLSYKFHLGKVIVLFACLEPIMMNIWAHFPSYYFGLFLFFIWGIIVFGRITSQMNYLSITVDSGYLSHCHAILEMSFVVPSILAGLLVVLLGNAIEVQQLMIYTAVVYTFAIIPRLFFKEMKSLMNADLKQVDRQDISTE